jgi:hypothetical protein
MYIQIAYPEELAILQNVYIAHCKRMRLDPNGADGVEVSQRVVLLFQTGVLTEHDLMAALSQPPRP